MRKMTASKNIVAIFTAASLLNSPIIAKNISNNITAYYENAYFNICQNNLCTISITTRKLEELMESQYDSPIEIRVGNVTTNINKNKLTELKEEADKEKEQEKKLCIITFGIGGLASSTIALKEKIKRKIKE